MEAQIFQSLEKFKQSSQQAISDAHAFLKKVFLSLTFWGILSAKLIYP